jgi:hypothetical protein
MRLLLLIQCLLAFLTARVAATALTFKIGANEKSCFFTNVDQKNAKIAFYFAVSSLATSNRRQMSWFGIISY